jgi:hemerythrin
MKVGIEQIDDDHRGLFAILRELDLAIHAGTEVGAEVLGDILTRMERYASEHFAREEEIQREVGYEGYEENHRHHVELLRTLNAFILRFQADPSDDPRVTAETIRSFLMVWISEHIVKVDCKMRGRILPWCG